MFSSLCDVRLLDCVVVLTALYCHVLYVHFPGGCYGASPFTHLSIFKHVAV